MSYLGKISALVTVNTGDFAPKLNAAAKDVRTFARTVEREIGSSMRDAGRAFESMYTPLQRFERAMRAATSQKLDFIGLPGAIRSIEELQRRLGTLNARQISVVLKATGMRDVEQVRQSIQGLTSRSVDVMLKVGGLEQLQELRKQLIERTGSQSLEIRTETARQKLAEINERLAVVREEAGNIPVTVTADAAALQRLDADIERALSKQTRLINKQNKVQLGSEEYDALEKAISRVGTQIDKLQAKRGDIGAVSELEQLAAAAVAGEREVGRLQRALERRTGADPKTGVNIKGIDEAISALQRMGLTAEQTKNVINNLLKSDSEAFASYTRQIKSAAEEIAKPLERVQQIVDKLPDGIAAEFLPVLARAQMSAKSLQGTIEANVTPAKDVAAQFDVVKARVDTAEASVNRLAAATGKLIGLATGREFQFAAPQINAALDRSSAVSDASRGLSPAAIQANPQITENLVEISRLSEKVAILYGSLERRRALNLSTEKAAADLDRVLVQLGNVQAQAEREIKIELDAATVRGTFDDLKKKLSELSAPVRSVLLPAFAALESRISGLSSRSADLDELVARISALGGSLERVLAVSGKIAAIDTSNVPFADPVLIDLLNRFGDAQKNATQIPGAARGGDQFNKLAQEIQNASRAIEVLIAKQEASSVAGERSRIQGEINSESQSLERLISEYETLSAARVKAAGNLDISKAAGGFSVEGLSKASSLARQAKSDVEALQARYQKFIDTQSDLASAINKVSGRTVFLAEDFSGSAEEARRQAARIKETFDRLGPTLQQRQRIELAVEVTGAKDIDQLRAATAAFAAELAGVGASEALTRQGRAAIAFSKVFQGIMNSGLRDSFINDKVLQKSIGGLFSELGGEATEFAKILSTALQQGIVSIDGTKDELNDLIIALETAKSAADIPFGKKIQVSYEQIETARLFGAALGTAVSQAQELEMLGREKIELAVKVTGAENLDKLRELLGSPGVEKQINRETADQMADTLAYKAKAAGDELGRLEEDRKKVEDIFRTLFEGSQQIAAAASQSFQPFQKKIEDSTSQAQILAEALKNLDSILRASNFGIKGPWDAMLDAGTSRFSQLDSLVADIASRVNRLGNDLVSDASDVISEFRQRSNKGEEIVPGSDRAQVVAERIAERQAARVKRLMDDIKEATADAELRETAFAEPVKQMQAAEQAANDLQAAFRGVAAAAETSVPSGKMFDELGERIKKARLLLDELPKTPATDKLRIDLESVVASAGAVGDGFVASRLQATNELELVRQKIAKLREEMTTLRQAAGDDFGIDLTGEGMRAPREPSEGSSAADRAAEIGSQISELEARERELSQKLGQKPSESQVLEGLKPLLGRVGEVEKQTEALSRADKEAKQLEQTFARLREEARFTITGEINKDQILGSVNEILAAVGRLRQAGETGPAAATALQPRVSELLSAGQAASAQDAAPEAIERFRQLYQSLKADVQSGIEIVVKDKEATERVRALNALLTKTRENVTFVITGKVQNFDQARRELASIESEIGRLDVSARQAFSGDLLDLANLIDTGDAKDLARVVELIDELREKATGEIKVQVDTAEAEKRIRSLFDSMNLSSTGMVQSLDQANAKVASLVSRFDSLGAGGQGRVQGQLSDLLASMRANPGTFDADAIKRVEDLIAAEERAKQGAKELEAALGRIAGGIKTPETPVERLEQALIRAKKAAEQLTGAAKEAADRNLVRIKDFISNPANQNDAGIATATRGAERVERESLEVLGRPTPLPPGFFEDNLRRRAQAELGPGLGDPERQMGRLASSITGVKSQLDSLPEGIRTHFLPAIGAAEQEFTRLRMLGPHATAEEIERAANNMRVLEASAKRATTAFNFRSSMGGANAQELELNLQGRSLTGYQAQLQILQQALGRVSSEARGPAAASFLALQDAISTAFQNGTLDSRTTRAEIQRLTADAVQATARVANIGVGTLGRQVARAGDVGRRGFDNLSLAINQGAFAIDDFLSSTGGLEFKLRAVSNNITQMAFILGGTTGLFIGLGAVIAGQVAVGLIKWANGGRTAEDVTKALNDALARQKSLVEELGQAFRSLGDTIGRQAFSEPAQQAREFQNQLADIIRKQRELSRARVADVDVGVQRERATQNRLSRELEKEEDPRRRVALSRQMEESRANERRFAAAAAAAATEAPTGRDVADYLNRVIDRYEIVARNLRAGIDAGRVMLPSAGEVAAMGLPDNLRREMQGMPVGGDVGSVTKQIETLRAAQDFLKPIGTETTMGFQTPMARQANAALQQIEELIQRLQAAAIDKAFIEAAKNIIEGSNRAGRLIASAQQDVADAIRRGVPAAVGFQVQLDRMGAELQAANDALAAAQEMAPGQRRTAAVERAQARVADVEARRTEIEASARAARLGRGFGGERTTSALSRLQGNDRFENERAGLTARVRAAVDNELVARRRLEAAQEQEAQRRKAVVDAELAVANAATDAEKAAAQEALNAARASEAAATASRQKAQADAEAAAKASDVVASLAEFALSVEQTIARLRKIGDSALQRSEGGADAAQRALEEGRGTAVARDAAERNLIADRERLAKANNALDRTRSEAMNSPQMQAIRQERERVESELKDIEAKNAQAMANNGAVPGEDLAAAQARQDRLKELERQEADVMYEATRKRREERDAIAKSIAARERELERGRKRDEEGNEFNRQRGKVEENLAAAERRRDEAQRRFDAAPTPENRRRRDDANEEVRRSRERQQELQDRMDRAERAFNNLDDVKKRRDEIAKREEERAALIAKEAGGATLTNDEKDRIKEIDRQNREDRARVDRDREAFFPKTQGEIDKERRRQDRLAAADRGRELGMTDRERFRREMETGVGFDIRARADQIKAEGGDVQGFIRQAIANQMEQVAPMLAQFQQERDTAMLQGPSRAALQISDVTTSQGMSELNRLLRGDDPSKDVNLAELRKQTGLFEELIDVVKNNPLPVI